MKKIYIKIKSLILYSYYKPYNKSVLSNEERVKQQSYKWDTTILFSIVVPVYNTPRQYLLELFESLQRQTYTNWELCIADGNSTSQETKDVLKFLENTNDKTQIKYLKENLGISNNTNEAISISSGDYIVFMDHDDCLTENALFEVCKKIQTTNTDCIYTNEDKIDENSKWRYSPNYKPDFSIYTLRSTNYMCHLTVVKTELIRKIGGLREKYDGSQDHDLMLRIFEQTTKIEHIDKILYHWREFKNSYSTTRLEQCKEASRLCVFDHLKRQNISATVQLQEFGNKITYNIDSTPLVSIYSISSDLTARKEYITQHCDYQNIEFISDISQALGDYLLFVNDNLKFLSNDWLTQMLGIATQKDVGAVGGKILTHNGRLAHTGMVFSKDKGAYHPYYNNFIWEESFLCNSAYITEVYAVSSYFMLANTKLVHSVADIDLNEEACLSLAIKKQNRKIIYTPYAIAQFNVKI